MSIVFKPKKEAIAKVHRANRAIVILSDPTERKAYEQTRNQYDRERLRYSKLELSPSVGHLHRTRFRQ
jgi:curved DNA-binding protein CbpA